MSSQEIKSSTELTHEIIGSFKSELYEKKSRSTLTIPLSPNLATTRNELNLNRLWKIRDWVIASIVHYYVVVIR